MLVILYVFQVVVLASDSYFVALRCCP